MRGNDNVINILKVMASSSAIFMGFFYYLGRQYTEAYYRVYGIPSHLLSLNAEDYLYFGVQHGMIFIAIIFTILVVRLWQAFIIYRRRKYFYKIRGLWRLPFKYLLSLESSKRRFVLFLDIIERLLKRIYFVSLIGYLFVFAGTLIFLWSYTRTLDPTPTAYFMQIMVIALVVGWAVLVLTDRTMFRFILLKRYLYKAVTVVTILIIVIYVQWLPNSIGALKGTWDQNVARASQVFNTVTIRTNHPFGGDDLEWQITEQGSYQNAEPLLVVHSTETSLFLISVDRTDVTFCVDKQNIFSITLQLANK